MKIGKPAMPVLQPESHTPDESMFDFDMPPGSWTSERTVPRQDLSTGLPSLRRRKPATQLALTGLLPVLMLLVLAPFLPSSALLNFLGPSAASDTKEPVWVGELDVPRPTDVASERAAPVRSDSYTSGFDRAAAGLAPLRPVLEPGRSAHACDESDPAHLTSLCSRLPKVTAQPAPRPAAFKPVSTAENASERNAKPSKGFFGFNPQFPTTHQLLSPFTFVGDKVAGLFKRS